MPLPAYSRSATLCPAAIAAAEARQHIPDAFLSAIGRVESGRATQGAAPTPWPWTINAQGQGHFYANAAEAVAAARQFLAAGVLSIDVGCLQINLLYHPEAFTSLTQAFDPGANAEAGARVLRSLFLQTGSWPRAAAAYHSMTPSVGQAYERRVLDAWANPETEFGKNLKTNANPGTNAKITPDPRLPYRAADAATGGQLGRQALLPSPAFVQAGATPTAGSNAAPPPVLGHRTGMIVPESPASPRHASPGANPVASARTLALYRAFPVQLAFRAPMPRRILAPGAVSAGPR